MKDQSDRSFAGMPFHPLAPRIWHGMTFSVWMRLLARNRFAVSPSRITMSLSITGVSVINSALRLVEETLNRRRIEAAEPQPPIFIIGHWRTGTTLMHELMVLDDRFSYPTTLQVMSPHHFLATSWFTRPIMSLVMPKQRPMDAMTLGVDTPQEDEFALCNLGLESSYLQWAWPNNEEFPQLLDLDASGEEHRRRWMATLDRFLKHLTAGDPRRFVFKSPTHTARVKTLYEMYPDASFVHVVRNPSDVIPSTLRTFRRLQFMQGLQLPRFENLEETVFDQFEQLHELVERDRELVPTSQIIDVRYEDLVESPVETIGRVYEHLELSRFESVQPKLEQYVESTKGYVRNRHDLPHELSRTIERRCGDYIERHGYQRQTVEAT